jgi:hypothetical protein
MQNGRFIFCELPTTHSFYRRRMIRFIKETKANLVTLTRDEDGRLIFFLLYSL